MVEQRELITICRQIGSMMEAGVDILRITRVLRAQTDNPLLLDAYQKIDHDLRMGQSVADAMERVPELFSPFAVSLVRQGEARNDIAGAFFKIGDFLQKEDEVAVTHQNDAVGGRGASANAAEQHAVVTPSAILPVWAIEDLISRVQVAALRIFTVVAGLLLTLAAVWASVELGWVERRWQNVVLCSVAALFIGGAGIWLRRRIEEDNQREQQRRRVLEEKMAQESSERANAPGIVAEQSAAAQASTPASPSVGDVKSRQVREATFE